MMTLTIVLAEITAVLLAVVIVISVKAVQRRRRDQDAVNTLVISVKANQPARVEKLAGMLKDNSHLSEDEALDKANELIKKQNKFYQDAIDLYFTRNNEILSKLDNRLENLLDPDQGLLKISTEANAAVAAEAMAQLSKDIAALSKKLEELRSENASLSDQLKAAENELDQLGREYVSAFNKPKVNKAKSEKKVQAETADDQQTEAVEAEPTVSEDTASPTSGAGAATEAAKLGEGVEVMETLDEESRSEKSASPETREPAPTPAGVAGKADEKSNPKTSLMDDNDEENLFADLGLDELIGQQPGQQAEGGQPQGKK
ncbi:MAG: hypothetical protein P8164_04730 [Gammaproteobacteria bacterium]|jgi:hypothetical protein